MSEKDKKILTSIGAVAEKLDPDMRQRMLGYGEGMAAMKEAREAADEAKREEESA